MLTPEQLTAERERLAIEPWDDEPEVKRRNTPVRTELSRKAIEAGIPAQTVRTRRYKGWPPERWFAPVDPSHTNKATKEEIEVIRDKCFHAGITYDCYRSRVRLGLPAEVLFLPKAELNEWKRKNGYTYRGGSYGRGSFRGKLENKPQAFEPTEVK
jgi:hypothetical protein